MPGYWRWQGDEYGWVRGTWVVPPYAGWNWIEPVWYEDASGFWVVIDGRWAPPGEIAFAINHPPPAPVPEALPPRPSRNAFWIAGHWAWHRTRLSWIPGRWEYTQPGFVWEQANWFFSNGQWHFIPGGWRQMGRPVG